MRITQNTQNAGRTIYGVIGHEAHAEKTATGWVVVTRSRTATRRTFRTFADFEAATRALTDWVAAQDAARK